MSENSAFTLVGQGGVMSAAELMAFKARPDFQALVALRRADDKAKDPSRAVAGVSAWKGLLDGVARSHRR